VNDASAGDEALSVKMMGGAAVAKEAQAYCLGLCEPALQV